MLTVSYTAEAEDTLKLFKQWDKRVPAFFRYLTFKAAESVYNSVFKKIPSSADYKEYKKSITLAGITGLGEGEGAAVYAKIPTTRLHKLGPSTTLIYVTLVRKPARIPQALKILATPEFNPWTFDTMPYFPKPKDAKLVYRRVAASEVTRRKQELKPLRNKINARLLRAGVKTYKTDRQRTRAASNTKISPSIVGQAFEMEFGFGATSNPHWKPAVMRYVKSELPALTRKDPRYIQVFTKLKFSEWKRWDNLADSSISTSKMSDFEDFFKKLSLPF